VIFSPHPSSSHFAKMLRNTLYLNYIDRKSTFPSQFIPPIQNRLNNHDRNSFQSKVYISSHFIPGWGGWIPPFPPARCDENRKLLIPLKLLTLRAALLIKLTTYYAQSLDRQRKSLHPQRSCRSPPRHPQARPAHHRRRRSTTSLR